MPKVQATKTSKIQSVLQGFPEEFTKSPNNKLCIAICAAVRLLAKNAFLLIVIKTRPNTKKRKAADLNY